MNPPPELIQAAADHMERQNTERPDPLRYASTMILELTPDQARPFAGLGECFAIVGRGSYPGYVGKLCLFAVPCSSATVQAAVGVVHGTHRASRIRNAPLPPVCGNGIKTHPNRRRRLYGRDGKSSQGEVQ
jgi:hypothetical protein